MRFKLRDCDFQPGTKDLLVVRGRDSATVHKMSWGELLDLRNFLDQQLADQERERRAATQTALQDDGNVALHIVED